MKKQEIKMKQKIQNFLKKFIKKSISLLLLGFVFLGIFSPSANAQYIQSGFDRTFFEIPKDDRNLRDFVFTDMQFNYKDPYTPQGNWSEQAKISSKLWHYNTKMDVKGTEYENGNMTYRETAPFFIVVDPFYYNSDGIFSFKAFFTTWGIHEFYLKYETDENMNICLYLDFENKNKYKHKLEHTCTRNLATTEPFLLFLNLEYFDWSLINVVDVPWYGFGSNKFVEMGTVTVDYTTYYMATYEDKKYITFHKPKRFVFDFEKLINDKLIDYPGGGVITYNNKMSNMNFAYSFNSTDFSRRGNQRAFRPYSFWFQDYFEKFYNDEKNKCKEKTANLHELCYKIFEVQPEKFFEYFVYHVATQFFSSPAIGHEHTYIGAQDPINGGKSYEDLNKIQLEECATLNIACHFGNFKKIVSAGIGSMISGIGSFFGNIWNGFGEAVKGVFNWVYDSIIKSGPIQAILKFFTPLYTDIVEPVYKFFWSFFDPIWKLVTLKSDLNSFLHGDQNRICALQTGYYVEHSAKWNEKPAEFFQMLFFLAMPKLPDDNSQICTSLGMKQLNYGKNTILDTTLFIIFFATGIWFALFIIRPR